MASADAVGTGPRSRAPRRKGATFLRGLCAGVLALLLGPGLLPPGTALADGGSDGPKLTAPASFRVAPHGGKARPDRERHLLIRHEGASGMAKTSKLTLDVTASADVLRLKRYGKGCSGTDRKIVCRVSEAYDSWTNWAGALPRAAPTSEPGDSGELHIRFRNAKGEVSRATTRVVVGGPVLALRRQTLRVASGKKHAVALDVRNTGELPADGFAVTASVDERLGPVRRSRSCDYRAHGGTVTLTCRFPGTRVEPGKEAHIEDWLVLGGSRRLMYSTFQTSVRLLGTGADNGGLDGSSRSTAEPTPSGTARRGTGAALAPRVRTAHGGREEYSEDKDVWTKIRIANHADYAAVAQVSAAGEDSRRLRVGLRNDGPGDPGDGDDGVALVLTLPEGTEVRKEPMEKIDDNAFEPICRHQGLTYTCPLSTAAPGETDTVDFEVRERDGTETAAAGIGKAKAALKASDMEADHADPDTGNNTRTFELFGPLPAASGFGAGTVAGVLGGCVLLAGAAAVLVRRRRSRS